MVKPSKRKKQNPRTRARLVGASDPRTKPAEARRDYPVQVGMTKDEYDALSDIAALGLEAHADDNGRVTMSSVIRKMLESEREKHADAINALRNARQKLQAEMAIAT